MSDGAGTATQAQPGQGGGGAGGAGNGGGSPSGAERGRTYTREEVDREAAAIVARGNVQNVVAGLLRDNYRYRRRIEGMQTNQLKPDHVAVPKQDADDLAKYRALGKVEEVTKAITDGKTLKTQIEERAAADAIKAAATEAGFNGDVLAELAKSKEFKVELRDETVNGQTVKRPYARFVKEGSPTMALKEFAEKQLTAYLPSLKTSSTTPAGQGSASGVEYPEQGAIPSGRAATGSALTDKFLTDRNAAAAAAPNPLNRNPAPTQTTTPAPTGTTK